MKITLIKLFDGKVLRRLTHWYLLLIPFAGISQFVADDFTDNRLITSGISFLEDPQGKMDFASVSNSHSFIPVSKEVPNFGISPSVYWLKVEIFSPKQHNNLLLRSEERRVGKECRS